jgi:hypothetical protein
VFGGLNRLLVTAAVGVAVLAVPPTAAFAGCNGGVSAVNVYKECVQTGGGGKPTSSSHTSTGSPSSAPAPVPVSKQTAKKLKQAGDDGKSLSRLVNGYGAARLLQGHSSATEPTAIGSAFDLGSGPTVLLIALVGTALILVAAGGYRGVRQHRRR